jgi:hypothetical protein
MYPLRATFSPSVALLIFQADLQAEFIDDRAYAC